MSMLAAVTPKKKEHVSISAILRSARKLRWPVPGLAPLFWCLAACQNLRNHVLQRAVMGLGLMP